MTRKTFDFERSVPTVFKAGRSSLPRIEDNSFPLSMAIIMDDGEDSFVSFGPFLDGTLLSYVGFVLTTPLPGGLVPLRVILGAGKVSSPAEALATGGDDWLVGRENDAAALFPQAAVHTGVAPVTFELPVFRRAGDAFKFVHIVVPGPSNEQRMIVWCR